MIKLSKTSKIVTFCIVLGVLLVSAIAFTLYKTSMLPESWNILSTCNFDAKISQKNKALIDETITTVADDGLFTLLGKESHLKDMGAILSKEVPDLAYWAYVLSTPKLALGMKTIQESSAKYHGFITGTRDRLMKEYQENPCLLEQAKGFAKYLEIPVEPTVSILKECIDNDSNDKYEFQKFLDYIIKEKTPQTK